MNFDQTKFAAVVAAAKAKAANSPRWIRAIDRAAAALLAGELIVTTLVDGALVTSANGSYRVNGTCQCRAAQNGHKECYHRAAARLVEMYEAAPDVEPKPAPRRAASKPTIMRSVERDRFGVRHVVERCDGWMV